MAVTGAGARGFAKVKPEDLKQDFGDQSKVIDAVFTGAQDIVKGIDAVVDKQHEIEDADQKEYEDILEEQKTEQIRLQEYVDAGHRTYDDFKSTKGFTVDGEGNVVYENQVKLAALQLKGGDRRKYFRNKKRVRKGKDARTENIFGKEHSGETRYNKENEVIDAEGNVITDKVERGKFGADYVSEDIVLTKSQEEAFKQQPALDSRGKEEGPSVENIKGLGAINRDKANVLKALQTEISQPENLRDYSANDNPYLKSFVGALDKGSMQVMWDYDTKGWAYVWKNGDKVEKMPVGKVKDGIKGIFPEGSGGLNKSVTEASIAEAIGIDKSDGNYLDPTAIQQHKNNFSIFLENAQSRKSYMNKFGLTDLEAKLPNGGLVDKDKNGTFSDDELFTHFQQVYRARNANYDKSLKAKKPDGTPSTGKIAVAGAVERYQNAIDTKDASELIDTTIAGVKITKGAKMEGTKVVNYTPTPVTDLEAAVEIAGPEGLTVTHGGTEYTLFPDSFKGALESMREAGGDIGDSINVVDRIDLNSASVVRTSLKTAINELDLSPKDKAEVLARIGTQGGLNSTQLSQGTNSAGQDQEYIFQNDNLNEGGILMISGPKGPKVAPDGVHTLNGKEVTVKGNGEIISSKDITKQEPHEYFLEGFKENPDQWKGIRFKFDRMVNSLDIDKIVSKETLPEIKNYLDRAIQGQKRYEDSHTSDYSKRHNVQQGVYKTMSTDPKFKFILQYYEKYGTFNADLLKTPSQVTFDRAVAKHEEENNPLELIRKK